MTIDIIIVNFYSSLDVAQCLARLGPWPHGVVWVVDNSDDAVEARKLHAICSGLGGVRVMIAPANLGFGRGCNLAFAQSKADLVLLLNPDARITPASIGILANALHGEQRWGCVSPHVLERGPKFLASPGQPADAGCKRHVGTGQLLTSWRTTIG